MRDDGPVDRDSPILADEASLPVDPSSDLPPGYRADQRDVPGGLQRRPRRDGHLAHVVAHAAHRHGWEDDPDLFDRTFPMDLRPQGFEIIRTWLFSSVLRSQQLFGRLPWSDASINGWSSTPTARR